MCQNVHKMMLDGEMVLFALWDFWRDFAQIVLF
jgi:hypothetical protein